MDNQGSIEEINYWINDLSSTNTSLSTGSKTPVKVGVFALQGQMYNAIVQHVRPRSPASSRRFALFSWRTVEGILLTELLQPVATYCEAMRGGAVVCRGNHSSAW
jgi:hypothetical protein